MATTLTISTTLPNGNQVSSVVTWANDAKARQMLLLYAQSLFIEEQYPDPTPRQRLDFITRHIAKAVRRAAIEQRRKNGLAELQAAAEDEVGSEAE